MTLNASKNWPIESRIYLNSGPNDPVKDGGDPGSTTVLEPKTKLKKPNLYKVLMLNDDYTPMEFVVSILTTIFNKPMSEAEQIMMHVHQHGVGKCGVYTYEVAETKVNQVIDIARKNNHPLQCTMEAD